MVRRAVEMSSPNRDKLLNFLELHNFRESILST
jgi:hypothetical protein